MSQEADRESCSWCTELRDRVCGSCGNNVCWKHGSISCDGGRHPHVEREGHSFVLADANADDVLVAPSEVSDSSDEGEVGVLQFSPEQLQVGRVALTTMTFDSKAAAIEECKKGGSLRLDGTSKGFNTKTGFKTHYLKCGKVLRVAKGEARDEDSCPAAYNVLEKEGVFTIKEVHKHKENCPHLGRIIGVGPAMRNHIITKFKTPTDAQTARIPNLPNLLKLRRIFNYKTEQESVMCKLGESEIRDMLIAHAKAKRPATDHSWIETLQVRVRSWTVDRIARRHGKTFTIPCVERVIAITMPHLASKLAEYDLAGIDGTYGLATKHSVVLNLGVYHERTFLPLVVAISSSMHGKIMDEETPVPKGESQLHYDSLFAMAKEMSPKWRPKGFIRDGAPQINNAVERAFPGVPQSSCYFHFKQALDRWLMSPAGHHLVDRRKEIHDLFSALHFASCEQELLAGLELLKVHLPDAALWRFLEAGHRLPGQAQSNWWFAGADHGTPTTACALEGSNRLIKSYGSARGMASMKNSCQSLLRFILDTDTRMTFLNSEGIPRMLESYYIDEHKERLKDWTRGLELADLLETTCALTEDSVITQWALLDERPINYADLVALSENRHTSWNAWMRWQAVRIFSTSWCECPQHQRRDFCKHVAAALAHVNRMRAPPGDVISSIQWNRIVVKRRNVDEVRVLQMLRNVARAEVRHEAKKRHRSTSVRAQSPSPVEPQTQDVSSMTLIARVKSRSRAPATGPVLQ